MSRTYSRIMPVASGQGTSIDNNNCAVRAAANCTGKDYNWLHAKMKAAGRVDGEGTYFDTYSKVYADIGLKLFGVFGTTSKARYIAHELKVESKKGMTLDTFLKTHQKGRYLVVVRGHCTCVIDGKIIDSFSQKGGASVVCVWEWND
jgi:hypothetical protein